MWFLFVAVPAAVSALSAVFSLTGGTTTAAVAVATNYSQRRCGYRPGEGSFTERANDTYYGVMFDGTSPYDINRDLWRLGSAIPGILGKFMGKKFDLTKSEGELLMSLMIPAMSAVADFEAAKELVIECGHEAVDLLLNMTDQMAATIQPVAHWLEQFPKLRIKDIS